jgi:hypothetical protein
MKPDPMETALLLIREPKCERTTNPVYQCITDPRRRPDAEYFDERWCNSCIAHHGLRFSKFRNPSDASPASDEGSDGKPSPEAVAASPSRSGERSEEAGEPRERKPDSNSNAYARARG